ncbi:Histidine kinase-, DNA gyrase B-, and HSP90-like ATPase [Bacillus sp. OV166]|uniref:sensor histidine kinase n=1 Tax=Bacillus sp. OV166 TaxID=1882763 RepID=UPI000A2AB75B|nr:histidine kinase [Bacillus sp. OV166]SMQ84974.1 Histidine kinase-, DNA gyrase B-, and HSP90-like ATPase [Bacillus sp. OV166]
MRLPFGKNPSYSINYYSKMLIIILICIFLINCVVSVITISITRQQSIDYIENTFNLYLKDTQKRLNAIDHFMIWTVKNEPLIGDIEDAQGVDEFSTSLSNFRTRVNDFQYSTGKEYQFFLALKKENLFFNSSPIKINYSDYLKMKKTLMSETKTLNNYENIKTWQSLKLNNKFYLYHLIEYQNRVFICLVSVDDILSPLQDIKLGKNGSIIMEQDEYVFLSNSNPVHLLKKEEPGTLFNSHLFFDEEDTSLPFSLHVTVDHFGAFEKVILAQLTIITATIFISLILFLMLLYIKKKVISPVQAFSKNLADINNNNEIIDFETSSIKELEEANVQFRGLISEIKKLKVNIYEQEIEKNKIQMDFMKLQIKPHFYLNCLTTIYSMAQMKMYNEIIEMASSTAKYFRYLFQTNQDFVKLEKELEHINDYLAIQKLVHGPAFLFERFIEPDIDQAKIPPLVIQTFIENTVKYCVSLDEEMSIFISIYHVNMNNNKFIKITIKDTGPGFPPDILDKLQNNIPLINRKGNQIGINNVVQRLRLLYGGEFSIKFSNDPDGGARIMLMIPYLMYEE